MITIIDYKRGNLACVQRGLTDAGYDAIISEDPADILRADGLILPGVGSFEDAMSTLNESGQADAIRKRVSEGVPFLGICLGQQLVFDWGNEGCAEGEHIDGLGLVKGHVERMDAFTDDGQKLKIPHVGWNTVKFSQQDNPLFAGVEDESYFYFTHSYAGVCDNPEDVAGVTMHAQPFVSSVHVGNVFTTQFHPEKSSAKGLRILANFGKMVEEA